MASVHKNVLLVEGSEARRVIPELIEANGIPWVSHKKPIVDIRDGNGYENLIDSTVIYPELKASGLSALGIIIDADEEPVDRWQSVRNACLKSIPDLPNTLSETGLIHLTDTQIKFGIWMMPDNKMRGMLETFLTYLIPDENQGLWQFSQEVTKEAIADYKICVD